MLCFRFSYLFCFYCVSLNLQLYFWFVLCCKCVCVFSNSLLCFWHAVVFYIVFSNFFVVSDLAFFVCKFTAASLFLLCFTEFVVVAFVFVCVCACFKFAVVFLDLSLNLLLYLDFFFVAIFKNPVLLFLNLLLCYCSLSHTHYTLLNQTVELNHTTTAW